MNAQSEMLSAEDMARSRTPRDLCAWVDQRAEELRATKEGRAYARSGAMLPKKLWEELRPLGFFALLRYGNEGVTCTPNFTNDNFDGEITFANPQQRPVYVELTYAKDGWDERLRLEALSKDGHVSATGEITVTRVRVAGRAISVGSEAVDHDALREAALRLVGERLAGKANKHYGANYVLVVVVDDYLPFRTGDDKAVLLAHVKELLPSLNLIVGSVYLLGATGAYIERAAGQI